MSDSSDSDNNNIMSPFFSHYLGIPRLPHIHLPDSPNFEIDNLSDSDESPQFNSGSSSSGDSDALLLNLSDVSESFMTDGSSDGSSNLLVPSVDGRNNTASSPAPKSSNWCITKELYNREIGHYNKPTTFANKFYQSVVAVQKLRLSKQLKGHDGCVNSLDFNTTGDIIASGSDDCRICLWNWSKGTCLLKYNSVHTRNIFQTKFLTTQGNTHIVSSARDGLVLLSAVNNTDVIFSKIIARHDRACNKLCVHPDLPFVVLSCGEDGVVKNIDIRESPINENESNTNILQVRNSHGRLMHLYGLDMNPMNPFEFIIIGDDEYVRMYDKRRITSGVIKKFRRTLPPAATTDEDDDDDDDYNDDNPVRRPACFQGYSHITSAVYNYCGTEILASYSEDDIYLFDINGPANSYLHHYSGHLNRMTVKGVNFYGPRSEYVISGSDCGFIFIWDKKTEAIVQRKHADVKGAVNVLVPHPSIPTLATSGLDKTIKIWEPLNKWRQPNRRRLRMDIQSYRWAYG